MSEHDDNHLLDGTGRDEGVALSSAEAVRRSRALDALHTLGLDISAQLDMDKLLRQIVCHAVELLDADAGGGIYLYEPAQDCLRLVEGIGVAKEHIGSTLNPGEGLTGRVFEQRRAMAVQDYSHWGGRVEQFASSCFTATLIAPLCWRDQIVGTLNVLSNKRDRSFDDDDLWLAELFAAQAAIAIGNARLFETCQRRAEEFNALSNIAVELISTPDIEETLQVIARETVEHTKAKGIFIYLYDHFADRLSLGISYQGSGGPQLAPAERCPDSFAAEVARTGKRMIEPASEQHVLSANLVNADEGKLHTLVGIPLWRDSEIIGVFCVLFGEPPSESTIHFLDLLAAQVAGAIVAARVSEALHDTAAVLNSTLRLDEVLERILANVDKVVPYDMATVMLIESGVARVVGSQGYAERGLEETILALRFPIAQLRNLRMMAETGAPLIIPDTQQFEGWIQFPETHWVRSYLGAPIRAEGEIIGFINLDSATPDYHTPAHAQRLQSFADQAAVAIRNARHYEAEHAERTHANALLKATHALSSALSIEEVLSLILRQCREVLSYVTASILIYQQGELAMVTLAGYEGHEETIIQRTKTDLRESPILAQMRRDMRPLVIPDVRQHPDWITLPQGEHIRAWMGVPLVIRDGLAGVLMLDSDKVGAYTEGDLEIAQALAVHAAIALENARLYEQTRQLQERFRDIALSTSDWLWEVDQAGVITYCSKRVVVALGYTTDELIGKRVFDLVSPSEAKRLEDIAGQATGEDAHIFDFEGEFQHQNGHEVILHVTSKPVFDKQRQLAGYRGAARDVTSQREAERREQLAYELGQQFLTMLSLDELMDLIVERSREVLGYYYAQILLYDADTRELIVRSRSLDGFGMLGSGGGIIPLDAQPSLIAQAARTLQPVISNNTREDPNFRPYALLPETRSEFACPLFLGDQLLGVLDVQSAEVGHFDEAEVRMLQNLAAQVSIAIENARLYQTLEQQADRLEELVRERTAEIARERERLMTIVENAGEGIIFTRLDGAIEYANPAWEQLTGHRLDEVIGQSVAEVLQVSDLVQHQEMAAMAVNGSEIWKGEIHPRRPDGSEYVAGVTIAPVKDAAGQVSYVVGVMHDITAQKEVERMRNKFIANVSHELRTPITSLKLYYTLLRSNPGTKREHYLDTMAEQVSRLQRLVEDLLDLSRLDRGVVAMNPEKCDLNALVQEVVRGSLLRAEERGLSLSTDLAPDLPLIYADHERVRQVLINLLTNAINYTSEGDQIGIRTWLDKESTIPKAALCIWDTGVGIAPEDLPFIFNRFFRSETAKVTGVPGTGLGLSIVKEIIELHRGSIKAESEPDQGSRFTIYLPLGRWPDDQDVSHQPE